MRRVLGRLVEWALSYEREVYFAGPGASPRQGYPGDAGFDLYVLEDTYVQPRTPTEVRTGVFIDSHSPVWMEMKSRSSTMRAYGVEVQDAVIDCGFRGELFAIVFNPGCYVVALLGGDRICQIVPHLVLPCRFVRGPLRPSERGERGFGSTG